MRLQHVLVQAAIASLISLSARASTNGTLIGTVYDPKGLPVPAAKITAHNEQSNLTRSVLANGEGEYVIALLPPGTYALAAEAPGFARVVYGGIILNVDQVVDLDLNLAISPAKERIVVTGFVQQLVTHSASLGQVVEAREAQALPLNERNFLSFALLAPGVQNAADGAQPSIGAPTIAVNGSREQSNNYQLDGADNNDLSINFLSVLPSLDAIQEFKAQTNNSSSEFGRGGGAQINVALKSGTNDFHGGLFEFFRNRRLDAKNFFDLPACTSTSEPGTCGDIPRFDRNQFGGTIGGPIRRDKTFFFLSAEALRLRQASTREAVVPSQFERQAALATVPPGQINPAGLATLNLLPAANAGRNLDASNTFVSSPTLHEATTLFLAKLDHNLGANDNLSGHYALSDTDLFNPFDPFFAFTNLPGYGSRLFNRAHSTNIAETHVFNAQTVAQFRVAFNRVHGTILQENSGTDRASSLGFPTVARAPVDLGFPQVLIAGFDGIGEPFNYPQTRAVNTFQVAANLAWNPSPGRHRISFGGELRRVQLNGFLDLFARGRWAFLGAPGLNALEQLLLGLPNFAIVPRGNTQQGLRTTGADLYVQDDISLAPKLTLSLGFRWQYSEPPVEIRNRFSVPDLSSASATCEPAPDCRFLVAGQDGVPRGIYRSQWGNFDPRVGVAWQATDHLVIRSAYGLFDNVTVFQINSFPRFNPPFFVLDTFINTGSNSIQNIIQQPAADIPPLVRAIDIHFRDGYMQQWNFGVQSDALPFMTVQADYVGTKGTDLSTHRDLNQIPLGLAAPPFPQFGPIDEFRSAASSSYHALQFGGQRRMQNGLSLLVAYTWSKSIDDASTVFGTSAEPGLPQDSFDLRAERALSDFNTPHRLSVASVYELPFGAGRRWMKGNGRAGRLFVNWDVGAIFAIQSGRPFTVNRGIDQSHSGTAALGVLADRPDQVADPFRPGPVPANPDSACQLTVNQGGHAANATHTVQSWFNPCAFAAPSSVRFGSAPRNSVVGPRFSDLDVSLAKSIAIKEGHQLQLRAEFFNLLNHPNFDIPNRLFDSPRFGAVQSSNAFGNKPPRQIQLALKYRF